MTRPIIGITLDSNETGEYSKFPWYALRENYCNSIVEMGGIPLPLPHFPNYVDTYIDMIDGLVVTGGDFDIDPSFYNADTSHESIKTKSSRTVFEFAVTKAALAKNMPVLGICGGQQLINVALGGTLVQHIPDEIDSPLDHSTGHTLSHPVTLSEKTNLHEITGASEITVNSSHHQSIKVAGEGLIINARAADGVIEGIEGPDYKFCIGVQWHPEYLLTSADQSLFKAFIAAAQGE